jgi:anti-sigma factor RsiW
VIEDYAFGRLSKYRAERVEEHLLFCRECQDRLQAEIEFAAAMREAAAKVTSTRSGRKWGSQKNGVQALLRSPG